MAAVWMRARAELRARRRQIIGLSLLIGLLGGLVLAAAAGARRTDSAYQRFLATVNAATLMLPEGGYPGAGMPYLLDLEEVASYPEVADAEIVDSFAVRSIFSGGVTLQPHDLALEAGSVPIEEREIDRAVLVAGRFPDPARADEIAIGAAAADILGIEIGEAVTFELVDADLAREDFIAAANAPPVGSLPALVVGTVATPRTFSASIYFNQLFGTPALRDALAGRSVHIREIRPIIEGGPEGLASFDARVGRVTGGGHLASIQSDVTQAVERGTRVQAVALGLFALLTGLALVLIAVQAVSRLAFAGRDEAATLAALGLDRRQRVLVQLVQTGVIGLVAGSIAAGIGFALAPLAMLGEAAVMDVERFWVDPWVIALGAAMLVLVTSLGALPAATRAAIAVRSAASPSDGRPSRIVSWVARAGASPPAVAGARLAVERGRGRTAAPVGTTIISSAIGIAALLVAVVFGASMGRLLATPALTGDFADDAFIGFAYGPDLKDAVTPILDDAEGLVAGYAEGTTGQRVSLRSASGATSTAPVLGLRFNGDVEPTVISGEWPDAPGEVALGSKTMRALDVSVGDTVDLLGLGSGSATPVAMEVVGRVVLPPLLDPQLPGLGVGVGLTLDAMREIFGPDVPINMFPVEVADGRSVDELYALFPPELTTAENSVAPEHPPDLQALANVTGAPAIVAGILVLLAGATLAHGVLSAVRSRRRDLATLKALGFARRQVRGTVAWQASLLTLLAALLAIPLGVLGGRWAWISFADRLGVVPDPSIPILVSAAIAPAALVVANLVALVPARVAARTRPAEVLRAE